MGSCLFPFWGVTALVILERVCQPLCWGSFLALPAGRSERVEGADQHSLPVVSYCHYWSTFSRPLPTTPSADRKCELFLIEESEVQEGQGSHSAMGQGEPQKPSLHEGPGWALQAGGSALPSVALSPGHAAPSPKDLPVQRPWRVVHSQRAQAQGHPA